MVSRRHNPFAEEEEEFRRALNSVPPPTPPDGGWGWVIVFSSFCINMMVDGVCYSYGVMLPELMAGLDMSGLTASLGGAVLLGTYMMSGPVASALCNKFGCRRVAVTGSLISTLALLFTTCFAEDGPVFIILFGVCAGIGFGLLFLASVVVVGFYFEKSRGIAATFVMCGSSVGMAVLAPLTRLLLQTYQWRGAILLLSGITLNGFVFSCLLRPLDADLRRRKKMILRRMEEDKRMGVQTCIILQRLIEQKRQDRSLSTGSLNNAVITRDNVFIKEQDLHKHSFLSSIKAAFSRSSMNLAGTSRVSSPRMSRANSPLAVQKTISPPAIVVNDGSPSTSHENSPMLHRSRSSSPNDLRKKVLISGQIRKNTSVKSLVLLSNQTTAVDAGKEFSSAQDVMTMCSVSPAHDSNASTEYLMKRYLNSTLDVDRPMYRKDIFYTGSVQQLPQYHEDIDDYVASITEIPNDLSATEQDCWSRLHWLPKSITDVLRSLFNSSTFQSPTYMLLLMSTCITMFGYYVPFLLLPSFAMNQNPNIDSMSAAILLSVLGAANTVGRVIAGALGSRKWVDSLLVNNVALLVAGGVTLALPFCHSYSLMCLFSATFGLCVAAFSSLRSVIVVELMGLDQLTTCFSQLVVFHGISLMIGTPLASYLCTRDPNYIITSSTHYAFYLSGGTMLIAGFISMPLRKLADWERKRRGILPSNSSSENDMKKEAFIKPQELVGM